MMQPLGGRVLAAGCWIDKQLGQRPAMTPDRPDHRADREVILGLRRSTASPGVMGSVADNVPSAAVLHGQWPSALIS